MQTCGESHRDGAWCMCMCVCVCVCVCVYVCVCVCVCVVRWGGVCAGGAVRSSSESRDGIYYLD